MEEVRGSGIQGKGRECIRMSEVEEAKAAVAAVNHYKLEPT